MDSMRKTALVAGVLHPITFIRFDPCGPPALARSDRPMLEAAPVALPAVA